MSNILKHGQEKEIVEKKNPNCWSDLLKEMQKTNQTDFRSERSNKEKR